MRFNSSEKHVTDESEPSYFNLRKKLAAAKGEFFLWQNLGFPAIYFPDPETFAFIYDRETYPLFFAKAFEDIHNRVIPDLNSSNLVILHFVSKQNRVVAYPVETLSVSSFYPLGGNIPVPAFLNWNSVLKEEERMIKIGITSIPNFNTLDSETRKQFIERGVNNRIKNGYPSFCINCNSESEDALYIPTIEDRQNYLVALDFMAEYKG